MDITRAGVIFAPDNYLFWNTRRRELANTRDTKKLEDEMQFLPPIDKSSSEERRIVDSKILDFTSRSRPHR